MTSQGHGLIVRNLTVHQLVPQISLLLLFPAVFLPQPAASHLFKDTVLVGPEGAFKEVIVFLKQSYKEP